MRPIPVPRPVPLQTPGSLPTWFVPDSPKCAVRRGGHSLYLFFMVFFGFYFLRSQSLAANYLLSLILTTIIMWFANQEI